MGTPATARIDIRLRADLKRLGRADAEAFLAALDRPVDPQDDLGRLIRSVDGKRRPEK
jgi:uncharacterized protein (DUF1778 family)